MLDDECFPPTNANSTDDGLPQAWQPGENSPNDILLENLFSEDKLFCAIEALPSCSSKLILIAWYHYIQWYF